MSSSSTGSRRVPPLLVARCSSSFFELRAPETAAACRGAASEGAARRGRRQRCRRCTAITWRCCSARRRWRSRAAAAASPFERVAQAIGHGRSRATACRARRSVEQSVGRLDARRDHRRRAGSSQPRQRLPLHDCARTPPPAGAATFSRARPGCPSMEAAFVLRIGRGRPSCTRWCRREGEEGEDASGSCASHAWAMNYVSCRGRSGSCRRRTLPGGRSLVASSSQRPKSVSASRP